MIKSIAAFLLAILGASQALAQAPPPIPPIADSIRGNTYSIVSSTPQIQVPFPVFGDCSDIQVQINNITVPLPTSLWNCASGSGSALSTLPLPITDMVVNFTPPLTSGSVSITGLWHPRNLAVPTAPGINRREYEQTYSTLVASNRELFTGFQASGVIPLTAQFASPPPIGSVIPNTGAFTTVTAAILNATLANATTTNFVDQARSLQSFGADGTGAADSTLALQTAFNSGLPLSCNGTFRYDSLITVTNTSVSMIGGNFGCLLKPNTTQAMIYANLHSTDTYHTDSFAFFNVVIAPNAAITSVTGPARTAAIYVTYPLGTNGIKGTTVALERVKIIPTTTANYVLVGAYLNDATNAFVRDFQVTGKVSAFDANSRGLVYDGTHSPAGFHVNDSNFTLVGTGVYAPQVATLGWQGIRIRGSDCVYVESCAVLLGSLDKTSNYADIGESSAAFENAGFLVQNASNAKMHDNYGFMADMPVSVPGGTHFPFPACYSNIWTVTHAPPDAADISLNACDGVQVTGFTGRYGVVVNGLTGTSLAGHLGPNSLTNIEVGFQTSTFLNNWVLEKQSLMNVAKEWENNTPAGANNITVVPPLAVNDGAIRAAGQVGEILSLTVASGSAISQPVSTTPVNVGSIPLTIGNWMCNGSVWTLPAGTTTTSSIGGALSTTTGSLGTAGGLFNATAPMAAPAGIGETINFGPAPFNVTTPTTLFLVGNSAFAVSTMSLYGSAQCMRYM